MESLLYYRRLCDRSQYSYGNQKSTVIAFDAGNLDPVIEELKKAYPNSPLIIAGDDDVWKDHNTGREKAQQAALKYGCSVVFPHSKIQLPNQQTLMIFMVLEGLEEVKHNSANLKPHHRPSIGLNPHLSRVSRRISLLSFPYPPKLSSPSLTNPGSPILLNVCSVPWTMWRLRLLLLQLP